MPISRWAGLCFLSALLVTAVFLPQHSLALAASPPSVVIFSAWDYSFDGPDTIPAGQITIRLQNRGQEPHQLQLLKLDQGKSSVDLAAALQAGGGVVPPWAKHMGGPNGIGSGDASEATVFLEPGSYVIICGIPSKNHQTHAALGMQRALRVADTIFA